MDYKGVFDITSAGYKSWPFPAFGLIFIAVGVALALNRKTFPGWWRRSPRASNLFAYSFLGFSTLWTVIVFGATYSNYRSLASSIETGSAKVVEGIVTNFKPMPVAGHAMERFCVQGTCFEYSDYVVTAGFNGTSSHGGSIREGLPVRVTYVGNSIAKLEVLKRSYQSGSAPATDSKAAWSDLWKTRRARLLDPRACALAFRR